MTEFKLQLGLHYRETIHGRKGVATARIQYLTGCNQYKLEKLGKSTFGVKVIWVDEALLELVEDVATVAPVEAAVDGDGQPNPPDPGGPHDNMPPERCP